MGMLYLISLNPMLSKNSINVVSLITPVVFFFDFVRDMIADVPLVPTMYNEMGLT